LLASEPLFSNLHNINYNKKFSSTDLFYTVFIFYLYFQYKTAQNRTWPQSDFVHIVISILWIQNQPYNLRIYDTNVWITVTSSKHFLFFSWETCEEKSKILTFALRHTSTLIVGNNTRNVYLLYCIFCWTKLHKNYSLYIKTPCRPHIFRSYM
jgi:hypothetical protein